MKLTGSVWGELLLTSHLIGREDKRTNNKTTRLDTKKNGAAGYPGPVKIELRKGAGLLKVLKRLTYESGFWGLKFTGKNKKYMHAY